jgi:hypothetical protein
MTKYVGLDVSQKTTMLCIVDGEGRRLWRGEEPIEDRKSLLRKLIKGKPPVGSHYGSGRSRGWIKIKNPVAQAVKREAEEDWGRR